jgi:hypothetical protein
MDEMLPVVYGQTAEKIVDADYEICTSHSAEIIPFIPETIRVERETSNTHNLRESWLHAAIRALTPLYEAQGFRVPQNIRVAIGWTSTGRNSKAIGECWAGTVSKDGHFEIFLKVTLEDSFAMLEVLAHELIHAIVGLEEKHGGKFKELATAIGLEGKMTTTKAGPNLASILKRIAEDLGPLPHAPITLMSNGKKKQTTRLIKVESTCLDDNNGKKYSARMSQSWIDNAGAPICPQALKNLLEAAIEEGELIDPSDMLAALNSLRMIVADNKKDEGESE